MEVIYFIVAIGVFSVGLGAWAYLADRKNAKSHV
jgi:hypothetical protein